MKKFLGFSLILFLIFPSLALAFEFEWRSICPDPMVASCANVDKVAYNNKNVQPVERQGARVGVITGVCWRTTGSSIGLIQGDPLKNIPSKVLKAKANGYYYIIQEGDTPRFLRLTSEIEAK